MIRILVIFLLGGVLTVPVLGQSKSHPAFIRSEINTVDNSRQGLRTFYRMLEALETGRISKVTVVHIGDSHLQADWYSAMVRQELQKRFGNAGRGLVFPYQIAQTNGPADVRSSSSSTWDSNRLLFPRRPLNTGISGMAIRTRESDFSLDFSIGRNSAGLNYDFDRITLFHNKGDGEINFALSESEPLETWVSESISYHTVMTGENLASIAGQYSCSSEQLQDWNGLNVPQVYEGQRLVVRNDPKRIARPMQLNPLQYLIIDTPSDPHNGQASTILLNKKVKSITIEGRAENRTPGEAIIYGMSLEQSDSRGLMYHMVGVNGAQFRHYNSSPGFWEQIGELQPDLVIVSLGTNEAYDPYFQGKRFYTEVDNFVNHIEDNLPLCNVLLTTPPDSYRNGRLVNPGVHEARNVVLGYAVNNSLGCWNLYDVMGGEGSIEQWYKNGLALRDRLHFSKKGYELQGTLLVEALMNGYAAFKSARSR